jgi:hypothetical protein
MKFKMIIMGLLISVVIVTLPACSKTADGGAANDENAAMSEDAGDSKVGIKVITEGVMGDFQTLVSKQPLSLSDLYTFIKDNANKATKDEITSMIVCLEELMMQNQAILESKYAEPEMQEALKKADKAGIDYNNLDKLEDVKLKKLVKETVDSGFILELSEGIYSPVIDYTTYKDLTAAATDDMKEYVEIFSVESQQPYAKDAELAIGWDEVIKRGIAAEEFLKKNTSSPKIESVTNQYKKYEKIIMFGLDNTPVFDLEKKTMNEDVKKAIEASIASNPDSEFVKELEGFISVVGKNGNKLTDEVQEFRNKAVYAQ